MIDWATIATTSILFFLTALPLAILKFAITHKNKVVKSNNYLFLLFLIKV